MVEVAMRFNQEDLGLLARQIPYPGTNLDMYPMRIWDNLGKFLCSSLHKPVRSTPLVERVLVFICSSPCPQTTPQRQRYS